MTAFTVGLDIGTTNVKALALAADGRVLGNGAAHHGIIERPGVVEADPPQWWGSACRALAGLATAVGGLDGAVAVGLSGNMSSVVVLGEDRQPLLPAPLLADARGADLLQPYAERITRASHNRPGAVFSLSTLVWLRDRAPEVLAKARAWVSAKDYVRLMLTGTVGSELTDAYNSLLVDPRTGTWDTGLINDVDLPPDVFPALQGSGEVVGTVTADAAVHSGLPAGVPVIAGMADMAAAVLGSGDPAPGDLLVSLGTSVTAITPIGVDALDPAWTGRLTYHPLPAGYGAFALASLLTGGLAIDWVRDHFGPSALDGDDAPLDAADPLVFLPHLAGTGTPDFLPAVRGTLLGLQPSTTGADIARALYEAIGCELAGVADLLGADRVRRVTLSGGGTRLPGLVGAISGVLDREVGVLDLPEVSALGAARLAWSASGIRAAPAPRTVRTRRPRPEHRAAWRARLGRYRRARDLIVGYYHPGATTP